MKFVWTDKAEQRSQALGLDERKAGTVAHIGTEILNDGSTARAWLKDGLVRAIEQISKAQWSAIPSDYKGHWAAFNGEHPEWKGRRTAFPAMVQHFSSRAYHLRLWRAER